MPKTTPKRASCGFLLRRWQHAISLSHSLENAFTKWSQPLSGLYWRPEWLLRCFPTNSSPFPLTSQKLHLKTRLWALEGTSAIPGFTVIFLCCYRPFPPSLRDRSRAPRARSWRRRPTPSLSCPSRRMEVCGRRVLLPDSRVMAALVRVAPSQHLRVEPAKVMPTSPTGDAVEQQSLFDILLDLRKEVPRCRFACFAM